MRFIQDSSLIAFSLLKASYQSSEYISKVLSEYECLYPHLNPTLKYSDYLKQSSTTDIRDSSYWHILKMRVSR